MSTDEQIIQERMKTKRSIISLTNESRDRDSMKFDTDKFRLNRGIICIWYHDETLPDEIERQIKFCLYSIFDYIRIFTNRDRFIDYLDCDFIVDKILFIINGQSIEVLCGRVNNHQKCHRLYELQINNNSTLLNNSVSWTVIHSVHDLYRHILHDITPITHLKKVSDLGRYNSWSSFSIFDSNLKETNLSVMSRESLEFLLFRSLNKVLDSTKHDSYTFEEMFVRCQHYYRYNKKELEKISHRYKYYKPDGAILYYLQNSFLSLLVQKAFRTKDVEFIFALRHYITDLNRQINQLASQQNRDFSGNTIHLYHSQNLSTYVLQKLKDNINRPISINEFLLASKNDITSTTSIRTDANQNGYESAIFQLHITPTVAVKMPYANLLEYNKSFHNKVLFPMCSVWRLKSIRKNADGIWIIILNFVNDFNSQLTTFHNKLFDNCTLINLSDIWCQLGEYWNAKVFYCRTLEEDILYDTNNYIQDKLTALDIEQKKYRKIFNYDIRQSQRSINSLIVDSNKEETIFGALYIHTNSQTRVSFLNNMGIFYWKIENHTVALKSFEIAIDIKDSSSEMAIVYYNCGLLEFNLQKYQQAKIHLTSAISLLKDSIREEKFKRTLDMVNEELDVENISREMKFVPSTVIKLRPTKHDLRTQKLQSNNKSIVSSASRQWLPYLEDSDNIIILCLGVTLSDHSLFATIAIENFKNDLKFMARILNIKDKRIFVIISTVMSDYVIPLIHKHYCIENIYLYSDTKDESAPKWSSISEKIKSPDSDLKQLSDRIAKDYNLTIEKRSHWDRSSDLFTMLYTQQLESRCSLEKASTDTSGNEYIIIFHCDDQILFYAEHGSSTLDQFIDVNKCVQFINEHSQSQIFLVISGNAVPLEIESIFHARQIHTIYFFRTNELNCEINKRKVSGLFDKLEELANQLEKDILFFRQQHIHTIRINTYPNFDREKSFVPQSNKEQRDFLALQLFIDILPEIPLLCANNKHEYLQMILQLYEINQLNDLFLLQNQLVEIQKGILESPKILKPVTVYLAKIVSNDTLKIIQSNTDGYLNIGLHLLATKSLLTARDIARQAADNGLVSVLFEIEIVKGTRFQNVNLDQVILRLSSVFRLISIDLAPDGVWYVKIKDASEEFQLIKEQFQLNTGIQLSWLTYGNYLSCLDRFHLGKMYFEYLLDKLPTNDKNRPSIYNNMGLMYTINDNSREGADTYYKLALESASSITSEAATDEREDFSYDAIAAVHMILPKAVIDYSTVSGNIGDVYYKTNNRRKAFEYYKKASELTTDQHCRQYYQKKILNLLKR